ncbi:MAG: lipopolysaccharide biosynthesis protein RfbH [Candidatus Magasanikbacteria bacterium]|jgi:CDP-4-dehydro-6-deoxyglucose reductase, E1|nr:lipopolysaccharide biosynthesis protein RfbH [Candidatus Magasanikbacteria bacterium]MBT4314816.1 lipopolysaccharide biosynthesis protein RfbH [Candidatus Magasanikbacteria bacterium]MBT4547593.1 lipopolysaccharide biosynthesis protein RfbH [Candidatus Magasanikbacteria bacterium]MBT6818842.1 lipopolysaccharide biosynthesis protein RfbH [Candidatus Magasanikbacteria bacterium]
MNDNLKKLLGEEYKERFSPKEFVPGESFIPVSGKTFDEKEILNMTEAVLDGWWTEGRFSDLFEKRLSEWLGVKFTAIVNSGSSANLVAFSALMSAKLKDRRLKPGDEVISVAAGFPTTVNPIVQNGLVPVFVDVDLGTYNINIEKLKKAIGPKTRAIFLAHTLGNPCELDKIAELCEEHGLWFVEDNCDALGSVYDGKKTGTFGHVATCSFYPAHHITMGEGGAVFTDDALLYRIIKSIRDWGRDCWCRTGMDDTCKRRFSWKLGNLPLGYDHKYIYSEMGYNLKVTDIQAALGVAQLDKLEDFIQKRRDNFDYLYEKLKKHEDYFILPSWSDKAESSWFGFLLTVKDDAGFTRDDLIKHLNEKKIGTRLLFAGNVIKQPYFVEKNIKYRIVDNLVNTDLVMTNTFWIGVHPGLSKDMLNYIVNEFNEFIKNMNKT